MAPADRHDHYEEMICRLESILTKRGHAAVAKIHEILRDVEREWRAELGPRHFGQLKDSPLTH